MTTADTQDVVTPADSRNGEAGRLCVQRLVTPRLLDLFCCAGGAGEGYRRAGFDVTGVDIKPQKNNPHTFIMADALEYCAAHGDEYDAIHASPPCQAYSMSAQTQRNAGKVYPDLLAATRCALQNTGKPWVIENVPVEEVEKAYIRGREDESKVSKWTDSSVTK
jgi:23S rRNA G2069 N7-methylase RlmK/C1962 C5-methylase RlmI